MLLKVWHQLPKISLEDAVFALDCRIVDKNDQGADGKIFHHKVVNGTYLNQFRNFNELYEFIPMVSQLQLAKLAKRNIPPAVTNVIKNMIDSLVAGEYAGSKKFVDFHVNWNILRRELMFWPPNPQENEKMLSLNDYYRYKKSSKNHQ